MSVRKIVKIDEDLCDGCGDCVPSCAEGAIKIIDGKAKLVGDNLCDGLGACLGDCPQGAITVEEREADSFDEEAVAVHLAKPTAPGPGPMDIPLMAPAGGCPGSQVREFAACPTPPSAGGLGSLGPMASGPMAPGPMAPGPMASGPGAPTESALRQWPVQMHLIPPTAPFLRGANLLLAADCSVVAAPDFHQRFLAGKALAMACPKLDHSNEAYREKLTAMIDEGGIDMLTVVIMEVPCCTSLATVAREAAEKAKRKVPVKRMVMSVQGEVFDEEWL